MFNVLYFYLTDRRCYQWQTMIDKPSTKQQGRKCDDWFIACGRIVVGVF